MKHPTPIVWLLVRATRTIRTLRQELAEQRRRNLDLEALLGIARREREQARRDADLVALMSRDPKVALEFLRDHHRIAELPEREKEA